MTVLEITTTVVHVAGPRDSDGFHRCLSCDEVIPGSWRLGSYVSVTGSEPPILIGARHRQTARTRRFRCSVRSWR